MDFVQIAELVKSLLGSVLGCIVIFWVLWYLTKSKKQASQEMAESRIYIELCEKQIQVCDAINEYLRTK